MDNKDIEVVNVPGGFWLRAGENIYWCQLTPHKQIPVVPITLTELP